MTMVDSTNIEEVPILGHVFGREQPPLVVAAVVRCGRGSLAGLRALSVFHPLQAQLRRTMIDSKSAMGAEGRTTMASYRKILLCYDGSREGRKALRCGADLALELKAETHLLSVVDMRSSIAQSAGLLTDVACGSFEKTARDILQEGVDWLTERGVRAQGHFAFGHPIDEIAALADELKVDLVVVGHRCRHGLSRWWMGAGNTPLLDRVSCSILVACSSPAEQAQAAA
jgi:nucleotide-binding universal stress UspA family protein